jgi:hypothetical protein
MTAIVNLLTFIDENWATIITIVGLLILLGKKAKEYSKLSDQEKVNIALKAVRSQLLEIMSEAEIAWDNYKKTGEIKKSKVFQVVYDKFPILKEYCDQDMIISEIGDMIDELKPEMDKIINKIESEIKE